MPGRNSNLQRFIDATEAGIQARAAQCPDAMVMAERIFSALKDTGDVTVETGPTRLAACRHLESAFAQAGNGPDPMPELADAFAAIEPDFAWHRRPYPTPNTNKH